MMDEIKYPEIDDIVRKSTIFELIIFEMILRIINSRNKVQSIYVYIALLEDGILCEEEDLYKFYDLFTELVISREDILECMKNSCLCNLRKLVNVGVLYDDGGCLDDDGSPCYDEFTAFYCSLYLERLAYFEELILKKRRSKDRFRFRNTLIGMFPEEEDDKYA
jgi:hypothetical protein